MTGPPLHILFFSSLYFISWITRDAFACAKSDFSLPRFARRGHDCVIVVCAFCSRTRFARAKFTPANLTQRSQNTVPERLDAHPNNQRPPLIDSEVLQSLNTSGALVADADPVSRIFDLAKRCSLRHRSAVIISRKSVFNRPCESPSHFHVLSFHISGSSFAILPKLPTAATGTVDSILMPNQHNVRRSRA
jgi:hypothetical protein